MSQHTLITNAEVDGRSGVDLRMADGVIVQMGRSVEPDRSEIVDAAGGAVIPGLTDHHLHLHALAATCASVDCGPPGVRTSAELAEQLSGTAADSAGWIRGTGYIESVAGELDRAELDSMTGTRPTRIQHRSGALWMLNSAAVRAVGLDTANHQGIERDADGAPTGRLWRGDDWLRSRLPSSTPPSLADVGRRLASMGITSVTDASPDLSRASIEAIRASMTSGDLPQRVRLLGSPLAAQALTDDVEGRLTAGPYKIVIADSDLPDFDVLAESIDRIHRCSRAVAVHCVSATALVLLLAVLDEVGTRAGDRIEHASVVPYECIDLIRRLGVRIVTQPGFIATRGDDYLKDVDTVDLPGLYRCRSFVDAGIPLSLSSDAPYGPLDPWAVMTAAMGRRTPSGRVLGADERIGTTTALDAYLGTAPGTCSPRGLTVGDRADVVLLHEPIAEVLLAPTALSVRATYIAGRPI